MAVLVAILAYVILLPFIALGLCVGAVLLVAPRKKAAPPAPTATQPARNSATTTGREAPSPDYLRRWNPARRAWEINELERFQQLLDG